MIFVKNLNWTRLLYFVIISGLLPITARAQTSEEELLRTFSLGKIKNSDSLNTANGYSIVRATKKDIRQAIKTGRVNFARELSRSHYIISFPSARELGSEIKFLAEANNQWKLSPGLKNGVKGNQFTLAVTLTDTDPFLIFLTDQKISFQIVGRHETSQTIIIKFFNRKDFDTVLNSPFVTFLDLFSKEAKEETPNSFQDISANAVSIVHDQYPSLNGSGITVAIKEKNLDLTDIDLQGRVVQSELQDETISLHANQMATIIGGGGNSMPFSKGSAWASKIISTSFSRLLPDDNAVLDELEVSVQNHSYGVDIENYYGAEARAYDASVLEAPHRIHVFSAGNQGEVWEVGGLYNGTGYANLSGNIKMAKNVLTVGAHYQNDETDIRNSRGPAYDGRVKPELVAYGQEGTSDAAAMVSGICLLGQHAYKNIFNQLPSAALIKASLIATADDIGPNAIDFISGYGKVNAQKLIQLITAGLFHEDTVQAGEKKQINLEVPVGIKLLRIALVWNDPPANAGDAASLVNDLDLELWHKPSGERWLPWVLSHYPDTDSLEAHAKRKYDRANNVEYITVENPPAGNYQCNIAGFDLTTMKQNFSLAYWLDTLNVFHWTYPASTDHLESDKEVYFRWQSTFEGTGALEVSIDGKAFEEIAGTIDLSKGFFNWTSPDVIGRAVLRMKIDESYYVSDTFSISPSMKLKVGYNCAEEVMLAWDKLPAVSQYKVFALGDQYLEEFAVLNDTAVFIPKTENTATYFAIAPVVGGKAALTSSTYDYKNQGVSCYYSSFLASLTEDFDAQLSLNLSTFYNVDKIIFEEHANGTFVTLNETVAGKNLSYEYFDRTLQSGVSRYRASILLKNGNLIQTDTATIFYADRNTFVVFPNPLSPSTEDLQVLTDGDELMISFYDITGKIVKTQELHGTLFKFSVGDLSNGLYLYKIFRGANAVASGRLVVN